MLVGYRLAIKVVSFGEANHIAFYVCSGRTTCKHTFIISSGIELLFSGIGVRPLLAGLIQVASRPKGDIQLNVPVAAGCENQNINKHKEPDRSGSFNSVNNSLLKIQQW